jgi:hypothetical protein
VNVPALKSVGNYAFYQCYGMETVRLPSVTSIGSYAFDSCTALISLSLPASPPKLDANVFISTRNNNAGYSTLTILLPSSSNVSSYTSAWGVLDDVAAGTDPYRYGSNHKQIVITSP